MVCAPDYSKGNGPALLSASGVECKSGAKTGQFNAGIGYSERQSCTPWALGRECLPCLRSRAARRLTNHYS
jgi:hypothetical protein